MRTAEGNIEKGDFIRSSLAFREEVKNRGSQKILCGQYDAQAAHQAERTEQT